MKDLAKDLREGKTENLAKALEGVVDGHLIDETQEEFLKFRTALRGLVSKVQVVFEQAAERTKEKTTALAQEAKE